MYPSIIDKKIIRILETLLPAIEFKNGKAPTLKGYLTYEQLEEMMKQILLEDYKQ